MPKRKSDQPKRPEVDQVVLVIHGIRDRAAWHNLVDSVLRSETVTTWSSKYGYFSVFRFLAPWDMSGKPAARVYQDYLDAKEEYPNAKVSVIAHSFGTQLLTQTLLRYPSIKLWRIILCGAVVKQDFQWSRVKSQIGDKDDPEKRAYIVNDCGNKDIWPVFGASAGWRYGDAGTNGFGGPVSDRFHQGGHGLFFNKTFIEEYWKPFIHLGEIKSGTAVQGEGIPWYVTWLAFLPLNWIIAISILLSLAAIGWFAWPRHANVATELEAVDETPKNLNHAPSYLEGKYRGFAEWMEESIDEVRLLAHPPDEEKPRDGLFYAASIRADVMDPIVTIKGLPNGGLRPAIKAWVFQPRGKGDERLRADSQVREGAATLSFSGRAPSGSLLFIVYSVEADAPKLENVQMKVFVRPGNKEPP